MTQEEITKDKKVLEALEAQYKHVRCLVDSVRTTITDLDFENMVPDADERFLMGGQLHAYEAVQDNLRNRIRLYRNRVKANKPEPWEEADAIRTVGTPCGPVRVVDTDKVSKEELCEMTHHCGLDAVDNEEELKSLMDLIGMEVVAICGSKTKCEGCARGNTDCVKLELVGGGYICLAEPEQDERTVISFEEEDTSVMDDIMEKTEAFMDYLESIVKPNGNDEQV